MRFEPAQNKHQYVVTARVIESLQKEPSLEETTDIGIIHEHVVPARSGKLVELTAPSDFEDGVLIIESPETPDSPAFVLPTVAQVKDRKVDVIVLNRDAENEQTLQVGKVRFSPIDQT